MIIQCKKCKTTFRFDETLMRDDGVWVRCSRCRNVFFQDNPHKGMISDKTESTELNETDVPSEVIEVPKALRAELEGDIPVHVISNNRQYEEPENVEEAGVDVEGDKKDDEKESVGRRSWRTLDKLVGYFLIFVLLLGVFTVWFFPQVGGDVRQRIYYTMQIIRNIVSADSSLKEFNLDQLQMGNVRQRYVNNWFVGNIRVIEGVVINKSKFNISRIRVKGQLCDAYNIVLGERESFGGNLLTDEELGTKTEEDIQKELSFPEGRDISNDNIASGGQIPFMIVFAREPEGVVKAMLEISGGERLLP